MPLCKLLIWSLAAVVGLLVLPYPIAACDSATCSCSKRAAHCRRQGNWWIATSTNFQVCSLNSNAEAESVARHCEEVRASLDEKWQLSADDKPWRPVCQIILHPNPRSYVAAVGRGSEATAGSSLVKPRTGAVTSRRIDLRMDIVNYLEAALPHEMCHVLVADRFRDHPAPLWYDEGLALLLDPPEKLRLHERDLRQGLHRERVFPIADMFVADRYPAADRMGVFYGQCASLTHFLLCEDEAARLHEFAALAPKVGVNLALQETYGIAGLPELERKWVRHHHSFIKTPPASPLPTYVTGEHFGYAGLEN